MVRITAAACALLAALALRPPVAQAQEPDPRPRQALEACGAGDVAKGISLLSQLYAVSRDPGFIFNQGRCYQQNGQLDQARQRFVEYLRVGKSEPPEDRARAESFIKEIDAELARRAPEVTPPPPPAPIIIVSDGAQARSHNLRVASIVLGSVGAAAIATGVILGLKVRSTEQSINDEFASKYIVTDWTRLERQLSDGTRYETGQWIAYGVGVAALAGAATTLALGGWSRPASREQARVLVAPALASGSYGGLVRMAF